MSDDQLASLPLVRRLLDREVRDGVSSGVQLSVSRGGTRYDVAVGDNGAGSPLSTGSNVPWTCSSKPLGALAFGIAWENGRIEPDDLVADHLPEYAGGGKDAVRLRDVLTHTTGVPDPFLTMDTGGELPGWPELEQLMWLVICNSEVQWPVGSLMSYNPIANWFTLDRVLTALESGTPGDSYRSMFRRLGLSATLGLDDTPEPATRVFPGAPAEEAAGLRAMEAASRMPLPGTGVWGTMRDLCSAGEVLLTGRDRDGKTVVSRAVLEALTTTHWPGTKRHVFSDSNFPYGLGFMTLPHLLGRACSYRVFGHAGGNTSALIVDPAAGLVIAVYWNGRLPDVPTVTRRHALVDAVYRDLGLNITSKPAPLAAR